MEFEIERTILRGGAASGNGDGVERFVQRGRDADDAVRRFLSRDRSVLTGDLVTYGNEVLGTASNGDSLYLLRMHCVAEN
ncbi:MAG: hypothetical protein ACRD2J_03720 [Thermoanaerobaculia bacterium]